MDIAKFREVGHMELPSEAGNIRQEVQGTQEHN